MCLCVCVCVFCVCVCVGVLFNQLAVSPTLMCVQHIDIIASQTFLGQNSSLQKAVYKKIVFERHHAHFSSQLVSRQIGKGQPKPFAYVLL